MKYSAKIKKAIQPFEVILAKDELIALAGIEQDNLQQIGEREYVFESSVDLHLLINNLAYWESISTNIAQWGPISSNSCTITKQVVIESGENVLCSDYKIPNRRVLRYGVHNLHEYRGKFFPQLVIALLNASSIPDHGVVLDPFCGSGTTAVETISHGYTALGVDMNPLSVAISKAKCDLTRHDLSHNLPDLVHQKVNETTQVRITELWPEKDLQYLENWFSIDALYDIATILTAIDSSNHIDYNFCLMVLSNQLRSISWQKNDDLRVHKDNSKTYSKGLVIHLFLKELDEQFEKIKKHRSIIDNSDFGNYSIQSGNSKNMETIFPEWVGKCNVIITSPPYATALPYLDTDRLSLVALLSVPRSDFPSLNYEMIGNREISDKQRKELWDQYMARRDELPFSVTTIIDDIYAYNSNNSVGFRRKNLPSLLSKYFLDMSDSMKSAHNMLQPNSFAYYVVGNNSTKLGEETKIIPTNQLLWDIGKNVGFKQIKMIDMELLQSRDIFKDNRGSEESILVFKK